MQSRSDLTAKTSRIFHPCVTASDDQSHEIQVIIESVLDTLVPKLVSQDVPLLRSLITDVFPNAQYVPFVPAQLRVAVLAACKRRKLTAVIPETHADSAWLEKLGGRVTFTVYNFF